jgi:hypothetical protein
LTTTASWHDLLQGDELDDGFEYPKTIAIAARRPAG